MHRQSERNKEVILPMGKKSYMQLLEDRREARENNYQKIMVDIAE